jgi:hypothetical protein
MIDQPVCACLWSKIDEQIERTDHLVAILPEGSLDFVPTIPGCWPTGLLLGHLLECLAGVCAVLCAADPERLRHFEQLRELSVNHRSGKDEARERIGVYRARIEEGFGLLRDADLSRRVRTVFVSDGEPILTLMLGNLEHLINHKHQLFTYLKMMGAEVDSQDLYRFRRV